MVGVFIHYSLKADIKVKLNFTQVLLPTKENFSLDSRGNSDDVSDSLMKSQKSIACNRIAC